MFYSHLLLSKKGVLGIVWMAAHCLKKLKKEQLQHTNISSSVDKILDDEVNVVTHRILAFLLLGVVRIYSKKVEYLFQDSQEVLNKLNGLKTAKSKRAGSGVGVSTTHYYSITLPKRFELDTFDLELLEDHDLVGGNLRSHQQNILTDERGKASSTAGLLRKEKMRFSGAYSSDYTPLRDVLSSHHIDMDSFVGSSSSNRNISLSGLESLCGSIFSLEDRLDPIVLDEAEKVQMNGNLHNEDMSTNSQEPTNIVSQSHGKNDSAPSLEALRGTAFSLDDHLDPMMLDEVEQEQLNDNRQSSIDMGSKFCEPIQDEEFVSVANSSPQGNDSVASLGALHKCSFPFQHSPGLKLSDEPPDEMCQVEEEHVGPEKLKSPEVATPECVKCQRPEILLSVVSKDSKLPEVLNVRTPSTKEHVKLFKKKRKILLDSTTMVSNKEFKIWLNDPSDLKRERKDIPHTLLHAWRAHKFAHAPQSFYEPSVPVISVDLDDLERKKINVAVIKESLEYSSGQENVVKSPVVVTHVDDCEEISDMGSPDRSPIAPGTPVTHSTHEAFGAVADSDNLEPEPASSFESVEKCPSSSQVLEPDFEFDEETNSPKGDNHGVDSARTRMIGNYLGKMFSDRKEQKKEQVLNLSQLVAGKTKKESARFFYEILVLKTQDRVDVDQENAYDDIFLREPK
ncbi:hypothetical protein CASFOL_026328 [Castilleja foliolosa]|uniref:Sister chromatid cohesion 1 protein 2 n=1 Tax=Castilleja foliolosa TaxID=1961234 RepID=A0ABD3CGW2_9LAMI